MLLAERRTDDAIRTVRRMDVAPIAIRQRVLYNAKHLMKHLAGGPAPGPRGITVGRPGRAADHSRPITPVSLPTRTVLAAAFGAALLPARSATKPSAGDPAPLLGRYKGRGTSEELTVEVTQGPQGLMVSGNGSPPRPLPWIDGWTFLYDNIYLTSGRTGNSGPATELGFNPAKGLFFVLKRQ
jgi:hypothetical protein